MGKVKGFLEPLQPEFHLQGQWSLCMVGYEVFLLGKGSSKPQKSSNQSKPFFVLISQRVGTGALLFNNSSKFCNWCYTYGRRFFKNADVCNRLMCTGFQSRNAYVEDACT